jgi:aspartate racemase
LEKHEELILGVIGGLGPESTHDFFGKLLRHSHARSDQDHLHVVIDSNPKTPNRNDAIAGRGPSPAPFLADMARSLERAGAEFIVMACNTAHAYEADIRAATRLPFVSLIDEVVAEVQRAHASVRKAGLLAAQGCLDSRIYHAAFKASGLSVMQLAPSHQAQFMELLYRIKAGDLTEDVRSAMRKLGDSLTQAGAELLIAACTEVPLVLANGDNAVPLLDSTDLLARRCVAYARRLEPLPR